MLTQKSLVRRRHGFPEPNLGFGIEVTPEAVEPFLVGALEDLCKYRLQLSDALLQFAGELLVDDIARLDIGHFSGCWSRPKYFRFHGREPYQVRESTAIVPASGTMANRANHGPQLGQMSSSVSPFLGFQLGSAGCQDTNPERSTSACQQQDSKRREA